MTIETTIFSHHPLVSLAQFSFCWWCRNWLMTSQWLDNCVAITWIVISNSLHINFIHSDIHGRLCKKLKYCWLLAFTRVLLYSLWIVPDHESKVSANEQKMLTHWGRDKMAAIFWMTFSNAFSWMKMYEFRLRYHWSLFPRVQLTISRIGSDNGLAPARRQAIIWTNGGLLCWHIYASLGLNELIIGPWQMWKLFQVQFLKLIISWG